MRVLVRVPVRGSVRVPVRGANEDVFENCKTMSKGVCE